MSKIYTLVIVFYNGSFMFGEGTEEDADRLLEEDPNIEEIQLVDTDFIFNPND